MFNVRTDVNACDCTRGCMDTVRESDLKVDSGREFPCRTGESNLPRQRAGSTLYQLSYIPIPLLRCHVTSDAKPPDVPIGQADAKSPDVQIGQGVELNCTVPLFGKI